ncbi:Hypothetical predicted protein, partial [Marmota monax]
MDKCPQERTEQLLWELDDLVQNLKAFVDNQKDDKDDDAVLSGSPQEEGLQLPSRMSPHMYQ